MVVYACFDVQINGLKMKSQQELINFRHRLKEAIEQIHPEGYSNILDGDVTVELTEHAGSFMPDMETNTPEEL